MQYKNKLNILTFGYIPCKTVAAIKSNFYQFFKNIKYAYQRIIRGYADCDRWNIDNYIAYLLPAMLMDLRENGNSYPDFVDPSIVTSFEDWQAVLQEMAEHFHNTLEWEEDIPINKEIMKIYDKTNAHILTPERIFEEDCKYDDKEAYLKDRETWFELEKEASKFREEEKDLACDMLKKWFFYLWD